jgi:hypothetical protein
MRFEYQKSYMWLCFVFIVLFFGAELVGTYGFNRHGWSFPILPAVGLFIIISEIRSGVAIDGLWEAKYLKGTWQYSGLLAFNCLWTILLTMMAAFVLTHN